MDYTLLTHLCAGLQVPAPASRTTAPAQPTLSLAPVWTWQLPPWATTAAASQATAGTQPASHVTVSVYHNEAGNCTALLLCMSLTCQAAHALLRHFPLMESQPPLLGHLS
jgi:hypothetical protein